jgi:hypothetical protein
VGSTKDTQQTQQQYATMSEEYQHLTPPKKQENKKTFNTQPAAAPLLTLCD